MATVHRANITGVVTVLLLGACSAQQPEVLQCGAPENIFDPFKRKICPSACTDALDCPRGTLCAKPEGIRVGTCELGSSDLQISRTALLEGFGVREMSGKLETTEALEFTWKRPDGARFVQCALFACTPAFRSPAEEEGTWLAEAEAATAQIANYEYCVIADKLSSEPEGAFNLRDPDVEYRPPRDITDTTKKSGIRCGQYGCAPIDDLRVGCWAYDDTRIVAATRLSSVDFTLGMYNYRDVFANAGGQCAAGDPFRVCVLPPSGDDSTTGADDSTTSDASSTTDGAPLHDPIYGICKGDECAAPCVHDSECGGPPDGDGQSVDGGVGYCAGTTCQKLQ